jgi:integrase/recombinase XerD
MFFIPFPPWIWLLALIQNLKMIPEVFLLPLVYRGKECIGLECSSADTEKEFRELKGTTWNGSRKLWCLPLSRESYQIIVNELKDKAHINDTVLRQYLEHRKVFLSYHQVRAISIQRAQLLIQYPLCSENLSAYKSFIDILKLKGYSPRTIKTYTNEFHYLLRLLKDRPVTTLTRQQVQSYLLWLLQKQGYSEVHIHTTVNALKFYFEKVEGREKEFYDLPRPKKQSKLPSVLAEEEVVALIKKTGNLKHRTLLMTSYSAGLRISELVRLELRDIDSKRMMIHVRQGKGKKDRMVPLSKRLLETLREYFIKYKPKQYLFEGEKGGAYSTRSAQIIISEAKKKAGIIKKGSIHMLRHSYATHLLEAGTDIRYIQSFLGHNNLSTTMIYTHIGQTKIGNIQSPLDKLDF